MATIDTSGLGDQTAIVDCIIGTRLQIGIVADATSFGVSLALNVRIRPYVIFDDCLATGLTYSGM